MRVQIFHGSHAFPYQSFRINPRKTFQENIDSMELSNLFSRLKLHVLFLILFILRLEKTYTSL